MTSKPFDLNGLNSNTILTSCRYLLPMILKQPCHHQPNLHSQYSFFNSKKSIKLQFKSSKYHSDKAAAVSGNILPYFGNVIRAMILIASQKQYKFLIENVTVISPKNQIQSPFRHPIQDFSRIPYERDEPDMHHDLCQR